MLLNVADGDSDIMMDKPRVVEVIAVGEGDITEDGLVFFDIDRLVDGATVSV